MSAAASRGKERGMKRAGRRRGARPGLLGVIVVGALSLSATALADYAAPPATVTLSGKEATNPVGPAHRVTATVRAPSDRTTAVATRAAPSRTPSTVRSG